MLKRILSHNLILWYNTIIIPTFIKDFNWQPYIFSKQEHKVRPQVLGWAGVCMLVIAGSTYPSFSKQLTNTFSPVSLLFLSELLGGIFVSIYFGLLPILRELRNLSKKTFGLLILNSLINGVLAPFLWFSGLHNSSAISSDIFSRSEMLFLLVLSALILKEKLTKNHIVAVIVILFGILFVSLEGFTISLETQRGDMLVILSSITYAVGGVMVKKYLQNIHPELIIISRAMLASLAFIIIIPFISLEINNAVPISRSVIMALLAYGFIAKFLGIYGFYQAIEKLKVSTVSMMSTLSMVGGLLFASIYLGENIYWYQMLGGGTIILGVLIAQKAGLHSTEKIQESNMKQHHRHHM